MAILERGITLHGYCCSAVLLLRHGWPISLGDYPPIWEHLGFPPFADFIESGEWPFGVIPLEVYGSCHLVRIRNCVEGAVHRGSDIQHLRVKDLIRWEMPLVRFVLDGQTADFVHLPHCFTLVPLGTDISKLMSIGIGDDVFTGIPHDVRVGALPSTILDT